MFNLYEKDGRTIEATELAYREIYAAQGYRPKVVKAATVKEAEGDDKGGSSAGSNGKSAAPRGRKSS
jgi:hypothetical protein